MGRGELLEMAHRLKSLLLGVATDGDARNPAVRAEYEQLRRTLVSADDLKNVVPKSVRRCTQALEFRQLMQDQSANWAGRRRLIAEEMEPLISALESAAASPSDTVVDETLKRVDSQYVRDAWSRALERRGTDPEAALTAARTLVETVCKHILDQAAIPYDDREDLPQLYRATARILGLAPNQHTIPIIKQILGGCQSVVEGLGALRSKMGDAHGKGAHVPKPEPRHAELAVNLAGSMATFLIATWERMDANRAGRD